MSRAGFGALILAAIAAGAGGYAAGQRALWPVATQWATAHFASFVTPAVATGPVIYYRDPDGKSAYFATPHQTADGRPFTPILMSQDVSFDDPPAAPEADPPVEQAVATQTGKILFYRNPMGLPDTSPVPKKDSMGMDYVPVYTSPQSDDAVVTLSPGKIQRSGVTSQPVGLHQIVTALHVPGIVQLDERRVSVVALRADAFVESVGNVTTGDVVHKGETLMRLYSPDIAAASAQYMSGLANKGSDTSGALRRLHNLAVPDAVIAAIRSSHEIPSTITWSAPQDGVIVARNISSGMQAKAGDVLFKLADIATIWIIADVPEYELGKVKIGAPVTVQMRGLPGRTFDGHVDLIYPQMSSATRSAKVRIGLANRDGVLLPDMYGDVEIADAGAAPVLAVPDDAVIDSGQHQIVILDRGEGRFEPRTVEIGQRGGGFTQISKGVSLGDKVVTGANFLIDAESNLQAALRGMDTAMPKSEAPKP